MYGHDHTLHCTSFCPVLGVDYVSVDPICEWCGCKACRCEPTDDSIEIAELLNHYATNVKQQTGARFVGLRTDKSPVP